MSEMLESWEGVISSAHIIVCAAGNLSEQTYQNIKATSGLKELPQFPGRAGNVVSFFDVSGLKKICLLHVFSGDQAFKNQSTLRTILSKNEMSSIAIVLDPSLGEQAEDIALAGMLSSYKYGSYKSGQQKPALIPGIFGFQSLANFEDATKTAKAMKLAMFLIDTPPNIKNPDYIAQMIGEQFRFPNMEIRILDKQELETAGYGAIISVGQASEYGSYLACITYKGALEKEGIDLVMVGKGVTFDTGGISLKDPANMHYMKSDLGGAAAVLGAMHLIGDLGLEVNVSALVPIVENAIDSRATRPGDVITAYGGKTIEIIDTDAEGRLILADALQYAVKDLKPEYLVDLATLTGNCVAALGYSAAGLFAPNPEIAALWHDVGNEVGERCWPMPMYAEYGEMMESDIADIKNFHGKPIVGAITAAKFLEFFTDKHPKWAHLDIAGVAFGDVPYARTKVATAFGVRLLVKFIEKHILTHHN